MDSAEAAYRRSLASAGTAREQAAAYRGIAAVARRTGRWSSARTALAAAASLQPEDADIAQELEARGFNVDRRKIELDEPIKTLGDFNVEIKLHRDVSAQVKVTIKGKLRKSY